MDGAQWTLRWWDPLTWRRAGRSLREVERLILPWTVPVHGPHYRSIIASADVPVSVLVHNALPHERMPGAAWMARRVLSAVDRLVVHAASVADDCRLLGLEQPIEVIAHPPDLPVLNRPLPGLPLRLLALGYIRPYKGTDQAIRAVARLVADGHDVSLTVAGEPWDGRQEPWRALVAELNVGAKVDLQLRYQTDGRMSELIASHHALIAPYRSATQSGVVAQALAAGRPVVATAVGGIPDLVYDGVNGTLADPDDLDSLVAAVSRLADALPDLAAGTGGPRSSWREVVRALVGPF